MKLLINAKNYKPSDIIKFMREDKGLRQAELGRIIKKSRSTIQKYEYGEANCSLETLIKIANICDIDIIFKSKNIKEIKPRQKVTYKR